MTADPKPRRRRWLSFSLRTLLVVTLVIASLMGWIVNERAKSHSDLEISKQLFAHGISTSIAGRFDRRHGLPPNPWWRTQVTKVLGLRVFRIAISYATRSNTRVAFDMPEEVADSLVRLENLREITLDNLLISDIAPFVRQRKLLRVAFYNCQITDLAPIAKLQNLEFLSIWGCQLDGDLKPLAKLTNLQGLTLNSTSVSDLTPLSTLTNLREVKLAETSVAKEQVEALQRALPNCKIIH